MIKKFEEFLKESSSFGKDRNTITNDIFNALVSNGFGDNIYEQKMVLAEDISFICSYFDSIDVDCPKETIGVIPLKDIEITTNDTIAYEDIPIKCLLYNLCVATGIKKDGDENGMALFIEMGEEDVENKFEGNPFAATYSLTRDVWEIDGYKCKKSDIMSYDKDGILWSLIRVVTQVINPTTKYK